MDKSFQLDTVRHIRRNLQSGIKTYSMYCLVFGRDGKLNTRCSYVLIYQNSKLIKFELRRALFPRFVKRFQIPPSLTAEPRGMSDDIHVSGSMPSIFHSFTIAQIRDLNIRLASHVPIFFISFSPSLTHSITPG